MAYDRRGRKVTAKPVNDDDSEASGAATPNAARLNRGTQSKSGPGMRMGASASADVAASQVASSAKARDRAFGLRVLPLMVLVAVSVLGLKVNSLWDQKDAIHSALTIGSPAVAQVRDEEPMQLAQASTASVPETDERVDPFSLGKSQIELLQSLAERREELDEREQNLIQREGLLQAAEHRIESKIEDLKIVRGEIEELINAYNEQEEQEIRDLVSIYEKMKPKDAARIFNELDMEVLLDVIQNMKASKTAPVLAAMDPIRAKEITVRIAERRAMPVIN